MAAFDIAAWRATRETTLPLQCGIVMRVKKVQVFDVAAMGQVPVPLLAQVEAVLRDEGMALNLESLPESMAVIDLVAAAAAVEPRLVTVDQVAEAYDRRMGSLQAYADVHHGGDRDRAVAEVVRNGYMGDCLLTTEIPAVDRVSIFSWAQQEAAVLATFPGAARGGPAAAPDGDGVPAASEPAASGVELVGGLPGGSGGGTAGTPRVQRGRARGVTIDITAG